MSYSKKYIYIVVPKESFKVIHTCPKCKEKSLFINTGCFRVNANGNKLDVWLIYQCEKCKHTKNLTIYERKHPAQLSKEEYERFLSNDTELAEEYGRNKNFFQRNKSVVAWEQVAYEYMDNAGKPIGETGIVYKPGDCIYIEDIYHLNLHSQRLVADVLQCSRSKAKKMILDGSVVLNRQEMGWELYIKLV